MEPWIFTALFNRKHNCGFYIIIIQVVGPDIPQQTEIIQGQSSYGNDKGTNQQGNKPLAIDNYLGGHSLFFVLGHHGFGFETLLGYRMNFIKFEFDDSGTNIPTGYLGKLPTEEDVSYESSSIRLTTSQVQLGIGLTFWISLKWGFVINYYNISPDSGT